MRVCLVAQEYPPETGAGGIGTQTYLKAHGLSTRGHEVHVVSVARGEPRTYRDGDAIIHRIAPPRLTVPGYEQSTYWLAYSSAVAHRIHTLANEIGFDIIQFPEYGGEGFIYQTDTFRYRKARYVVQLHGPLSMFAEQMGWPEIGSTFYQIGCFMERTSIQHTDLVLASSHNTAAFCASHYDYPLNQIQVIHSGLDTTRFAPKPRVADERHPKILFVGNMAASKGFDLLINAVLHLRERYPRICLRTIGRGKQDQLQRLATRIAEAGAAANFDIKGYVANPDLPQHYAWCDFFAGPSTFEPGPGNVYLEAMACGRAVIACNTGGAPEVVLDQETGLLVPPRHSDALEAAMVSLAEDTALREALGRRGRAWVAGNFSLERYIDKVESLYKALL